MNRRGFMKLLALTPLAGLLKPEPKKITWSGGVWVPEKSGGKRIQGQSADMIMFDERHAVGTIVKAESFFPLVKTNGGWEHLHLACKNMKSNGLSTCRIVGFDSYGNSMAGQKMPVHIKRMICGDGKPANIADTQTLNAEYRKWRELYAGQQWEGDRFVGKLTGMYNPLKNP